MDYQNTTLPVRGVVKIIFILQITEEIIVCAKIVKKMRTGSGKL